MFNKRLKNQVETLGRHVYCLEHKHWLDIGPERCIHSDSTGKKYIFFKCRNCGEIFSRTLNETQVKALLDLKIADKWGQ